ncbi:uncharacterized protein nts isoform 4-T5 [Syngnathus typhle]
MLLWRPNTPAETWNSKGGGGEEGGGGGNSGMFYWCNTATLHLRGQPEWRYAGSLGLCVAVAVLHLQRAVCRRESFQMTWSRNWENNSSAACLLPSTPLYSVFNMITFLLILKQLKQASKQSAPYWRLSLNNLCRLAGGMLLGGEAEEAAWRRRSGEEAEEGEEEEDEDEEGEQQMMMREWSNQRLEELYNLQNICRALLHSRQGRLRHDSREYAAGNGGEAALKRKSPYILKRQATHLSKSRRPYILKRSEIY